MLFEAMILTPTFLIRCALMSGTFSKHVIMEVEFEAEFGIQKSF